MLVATGATCALGIVPLRTTPDLPEGSIVTLLVRPEQLRLGLGDAARVEEVTFYGPHASVRLALPEGTMLLARVDPSAVPVAGDLVGVEVTGVGGVFG